jgi:hypothetical protein
MDDEFLLGTSPARVLGEVTERQRGETIGEVIVNRPGKVGGSTL